MTIYRPSEGFETISRLEHVQNGESEDGGNVQQNHIRPTVLSAQFVSCDENNTKVALLCLSHLQ